MIAAYHHDQPRTRSAAADLSEVYRNALARFVREPGYQTAGCFDQGREGGLRSGGNRVAAFRPSATASAWSPPPRWETHSEPRPQFETSATIFPTRALLNNVDLVVSVNTGVLHLAAILGAPTVALNGPTSTLRWGPLGPRATSVEPHGGGGGFLHLGFEFSGNPTDSMQRIRVEDVVAAALLVQRHPVNAPSG